jgi:hypothetical protein
MLATTLDGSWGMLQVNGGQQRLHILALQQQDVMLLVLLLLCCVAARLPLQD